MLCLTEAMSVKSVSQTWCGNLSADGDFLACVEYFFKYEFILVGYYLPNDDGEFYQFCYVTYKGEIRGASTPFQFRTASPVEELLTMEDEGNSDMLVVTTKAGLLEVWYKNS